MGIVVRQSLKASIVSYFAVAIGAINILFVSTKYLDPDQLALARILLENSLIFASFAHLGTPFISNKFFVFFKDEKQQHHNFLAFLLTVPILGLCLFVILYLLFQNTIITYFSQNAAPLTKYYLLCIPLTAFWVYVLVLESYIRNHARIVVPTFVKEVYLKTTNIGLTIVFGLGWLSFEWMLYGIIGTYLGAVIILVGYIKNLGKWFLRFDLQIYKSKYIKQMLYYGLFIILGGIGQNLVLFIDRVMLAGEGSLTNASIFIIATYIASIIEIPKKTITQISIPIISEAIELKQRDKMQELYHKIALNQLLATGLLFLGIWCSIDELLSLLPKADIYSQGKLVILIVGVAKLIDITFGPSAEFILYSSHYRFVNLLVIPIAGLNILLNYIFIPLYQYNGAALATLLVTLIYSVTRVGFFWHKFKIPFLQKSYLWLLGLIVFIWYASTFIPTVGNGVSEKIITIFIKSVWVAGAYLGAVFYLKISPEFNQILHTVWKKYRK